MPYPHSNPIHDSTMDFTTTLAGDNPQLEVEMVAASPSADFIDDHDDSDADVWADDDEGEIPAHTQSSLSHETPLPDKRLYSTHNNAGYRIGLESARAKVAQQGFDAGYAVGGDIGIRVGELLGVILGSLAAIEDGQAVGPSSSKSNTDDRLSKIELDHENEKQIDFNGAVELKEKIEAEWLNLAKTVWIKFGDVGNITEDLGIDSKLLPDHEDHAHFENRLPVTERTDNVVRGYTELQLWMGRMEHIMDRLGVAHGDIKSERQPN